MAYACRRRQRHQLDRGLQHHRRRRRGPGDCTLAFAGTLANNLSSDASCGFTAANGGKPSTNPLLGDLGDNGGSTPTRRPAAASPALNAGTPTGCPTWTSGG